MKTSEFINIVKEIPTPEEVEVFRLFMTLNEELFVTPVREVIVKRGGYTLLQTGGTPQKAGAINGICHKPANMTLADCMDMLLDLTQKNELLTYESSGADLWEDVTTGTPHPSAQVAHLFYDDKSKRLFLAGDKYMPQVISNKIA